MASQKKHRRWVSRSALCAALIAGGASLSALAAPAKAQQVTMVAVAGEDTNIRGTLNTFDPTCGQGAIGKVNFPAILTVNAANSLGVSSSPLAGLPVGKGQLWELQPTGDNDGEGNIFVYIINALNGFALTSPLTSNKLLSQSLVLTPLTHANTQKWLRFHVAASFAPGAFGFSNNKCSLPLIARGTSWRLVASPPLGKSPPDRPSVRRKKVNHGKA